MVPKVLLDLFEFVKTHARVVDTDCLEPVPNGLTHQSRCYSAVDTAADGAEHESFGADEIANASNLEVNKVAHFPVRLGSANIDAEIAQEVGSTGCLDSNVRGVPIMRSWVTNMFELRMELNA